MINECPINDVAAKFKFTRGTLQSLQQTASTFAGIVKSFCHALNWDLLALIISQLQDRIFFGVHQELIEIMKIPMLSVQSRARALFKSGYQNLVAISTANSVDIEKCLYDSLSFDVGKRDGEANYDAEQRNKSRLLFVTGRAGLTIKEAAILIITEARQYLQNEMGLVNIEWSQNQSETNKSEMPENLNQSNRLNEYDNNSENHSNTEVLPSRQTAKEKLMPKRKIELTENESEDSDAGSDSEGLKKCDSISSIYNDENDDIWSSSESTTLSYADKTSSERLLTLYRLDVVDVTETSDTFNKFVKSFGKVTACGFALAVTKRQESNGNYRCIISNEFFICGVSLCFEQNRVHYISLQDDSQIAFASKIEFLEQIFQRKNLTMKIYDAKRQLKTILKLLPNISQVSGCIEDPKVAHWLLQPDTENSFHQMVLVVFHFMFTI